MDTTVYIVRKGRLHIIDDDAMTTEIITEIKDGGQALSEFEFYRKGKPVYMAKEVERSDNGSKPKYAPPDFPPPADYGITSPELYAKAVTYRDAMKKFIECCIKKKPSMAAEIKKIMVLAMPITIIVFLIFIMVLAMGG